MNRINANSKFLKKLIEGKAKQRVFVLNRCSEDELKLLVECVVNIKYFKLAQLHSVLVKTVKPLRDCFRQRRNFSVVRIRNILKRHNKLLQKLLSDNSRRGSFLCTNTMTTILRVIPNSLYERIFEDGYLEDTYPCEKPNDVDLLVKNIPVTLRGRAKTILQHLKDVENFSWTGDGQVVCEQNKLRNFNLSDLVKHLVFQSTKLFNLPGSQQFLLAVSKIPCNLYKLPLSNKSTTSVHKADELEESWISFDDRFKING
jgi:hypothetical protein